MLSAGPLVPARGFGHNHGVAPSPSTLLVHPDYGEDDARGSARPIAPILDRSSTHSLDGPGAEALAERSPSLREHDC